MRPILAAALAAAIAVPAVAQVIPTAADQPGQPQRTRVAAGTYQVDPAHTQVAWSVNHLGFSTLEGLFGAAAGTLTIDPAKPAAAKVEVSFQIDQLAVTSTAFAAHLKSDQIFEVAKFPTARFVSTRVTPAGANRAQVAGELTIKGVTKPVTLDASFVGAGTNPMSKKSNIGFDATATIRRSDFGVGIAVPVVSDTVKLSIHAAFVGA